MHDMVILGDGALGRAVEPPGEVAQAEDAGHRGPFASSDALGTAGTIPRRWPGHGPRRRRLARRRGRRPTSRAALDGGLPILRHRHDRLGRRPRPRRDAADGSRRGRGRRLQLQPRRRAVRPARRGRGRAVRPARGVRSVSRRMAPPREARPAVRHRPGPRPPDRRGPSAPGRRPTTSRSCRSAPARRRGCTSSASTPPARPSSSA